MKTLVFILLLIVNLSLLGLMIYLLFKIPQFRSHINFYIINNRKLEGRMKEKQIENQIKKYLKSIGAYVVKYFGCTYSQAGVPDLIICYKGRFIAIEVKTDSNKTSSLQDINIQQIKKAGGIAFVARNLEEVKCEIRKI